MTITTTSTDAYAEFQSLRDPVEPVSSFEGADEVAGPALPKLFWAGSILFAANVAVLIGIWVSPELKVNMYGEMPESPAAAAMIKPSPFTEVVQTASSKSPKQAPKLLPTAFTEPTPADPAWAQLDVPRVTRVAASDTQLDVRRATPATLTVYSPDNVIPVRRATQNPVLNTSPLEAAPRRAPERAQVISN